MGVLRLGWVTQLLSNAVIVGFTSGAGIIIALSQVCGRRIVHLKKRPVGRMHNNTRAAQASIIHDMGTEQPGNASLVIPTHTQSQTCLLAALFE